MILEKLRKDVFKTSLKALDYKLISLSGGVFSDRDSKTGYIAITPSGMYYKDLIPEDIVVIDVDGKVIDGERKPSVDTKAFLYIYQNKNDVNAIIHTHQVYATCFAVLKKEIPAVTTTLANAVGGAVSVADYTPVGSNNYGINIVKAIGDQCAVLLQNHGVITVGRNLKEAFTVAVYLEDTAKIYYLALNIGKPLILPDEEIKKARELFLHHYGQ